ncbi:PNK3P-domain-containing protein [Obba rivulosa]|uniref:PNK3P-domain-containing protein n=1 Tax=Obba rivulosa TaxID=1052685 RepID=A0A8E2DT78_9APHY|nr:PNK3P-domain-containing protein [Obba rivulosa]
MSAASKKRSADHLDDPAAASSSKRVSAKPVFPVFDKPGAAADTTPSTFQWLPPLGPNKTCLHAINLAPESRPKVAALDLDGCLIQSSFPKKAKGSAPPTFQWWRPIIPNKLKELYDDGYAIVIVTNQALKSAALVEWKKKLPLIGAALPDVPFRLFAATARDGFRKPMPGMWYELERIFAEGGVTIDKKASIFVGDAAGRASDFAGTDRKWALNLDLPFHTPEEFFLKLPQAPYTLTGFHPSSLQPDAPPILPSSTPLLPSPLTSELVLFVGPPALGKSTFFRRHFAPAGYVHVNQDTLKTREKCVRAAKEALQEGKAVVVDNTNRDRTTRKLYVDVARTAGVPIRCFVFTGSVELAWHNNLYRAYNLPPALAASEPKREVLPYMAFSSFRAAYEEPAQDEGFAEIRRVQWTFEGDEEARGRWNMWLQVDGK